MAGMETGADAAATLEAPPGITQPDPSEGGRADSRLNVAKDIGEKVEGMITAAKQASETKVSAEIRKIKQRMEQLKEKIQLINERVNRLNGDQQGAGGNGLLKADLQRSIGKLEEVWQNEVSTLKQELWQTIQAHNHNADLLKSHRDAIDQVHSKLPGVQANPEMMNIHRQLLQVDAIMEREQQKQQQLDQLVQRFAAVHQAAQSIIGAWADGGLSAAYGSSAVPPGGASGESGGGAAPQKKAHNNKKPGAKAAKPGEAPAKASAEPMKVTSQAATALRPEAPEFVPAVPPNWPEEGA